MEKSNTEKVKDLIFYAPVGAFGFVKDNAPTFFNMFVSRGKRDVAKSTMVAEDKIAESKEKGQMVAMGTPIAKEKGESFASAAYEVAGAAFSVASEFISSLISSTNEEPTEQREGALSNDSDEGACEGSLPSDLKEIYDALSAPEIIDRLDNFSKEELLVIQQYEAGFRNRQTILHAIGHRLNS